MIALQVSHSLQFPWTMTRSMVKINVNQFSPVTKVVPFSFSSPVVFVGSLSCSLLDVPVMQLPPPESDTSKTSWTCFGLEVATKDRNGLCNQQVTSKTTFTANGRREIVPRDQLFPFTLFVCCLLFLHGNYFFFWLCSPISFFWTVLSVYFLNLENSQPSSHFCRLP